MSSVNYKGDQFSHPILDRAVYLQAREDLFGVTNSAEWGKKLDERFRYFLRIFIRAAKISGATLPLAIADDKDASFRSFVNHAGPKLVLGMVKSHMDKSDLTRSGLALLIISVNILRNTISTSCIEAGKIADKLSQVKGASAKGADGKVSMKNLKGMFMKKTKSSSNINAKSAVFTENPTEAEEKPPKKASGGVPSPESHLHGNLKKSSSAKFGSKWGGMLQEPSGVKAFKLASDLSTHRALIEWGTLSLDDFADGGRSVSTCVTIMLHSILGSVRGLALTLLSLVVTVSSQSCRAMLLPYNCSKEFLESVAMKGKEFWGNHDPLAAQRGLGGYDDPSLDNNMARKNRKVAKRVPTELEKSLESAFASTSSFPIIAKRLGVYCSENDPKAKKKVEKAKVAKEREASNANGYNTESNEPATQLSKEEIRRREKEQEARAADARERGASCLSYVLSVAKSERNSAIFAAAAEIVLALTCDIELPSDEAPARVGETPVNMRAALRFSGIKGETASRGTILAAQKSMNMGGSAPARAILIKTNNLPSDKHKLVDYGPHATKDEVETKMKDAASGDPSSSTVKRENAMAKLMSVFCAIVSRTPTCDIPDPDPAVASGTAVKGSPLSRSIRKQVVAAATLGGKEESKPATSPDEKSNGNGAHGDAGAHEEWSCLAILIDFLRRNLRYFDSDAKAVSSDVGVSILGKAGMSLQQQQELVYAFQRCLAATSRLVIKSRDALYHVHEMKGVDRVLIGALNGLKALSKGPRGATQGDSQLTMSSQTSNDPPFDESEPANAYHVYIRSADYKHLHKVTWQAIDLLHREKKKFYAQAEETRRSKGIYIGKDGKETRLRPKQSVKLDVQGRPVNQPMTYTQTRPHTSSNASAPSNTLEGSAATAAECESLKNSLDGDYGGGGSFGSSALLRLDEHMEKIGASYPMNEGSIDGPAMLQDHDGTVLQGYGAQGRLRKSDEVPDLFASRPATTGMSRRPGGGGSIRPLSREFGKSFRSDCAYSIPEMPLRRGLSPKHKSRDDATSLHKVLFQGKMAEHPPVPVQLQEEDVEAIIDNLALKWDGNNPNSTNLTATNPLSTERYLPGGSMEFTGQGGGGLEGAGEEGRPSTAPNIQGSMTLPDGFLESRKLLRALQKTNRNTEGRLNRIGYTSEGKHSIPILERARRAYYPAGNVITEEMQSTGDLGDCSTEFEMTAARDAALGTNSGMSKLKRDTAGIKAEAFEKAEAAVAASFEATEDSRKHKEFIESMLELTKSAVTAVETESVVRDVSLQHGMGFVEEGMRRAINSREGGSRPGTREGGGERGGKEESKSVRFGEDSQVLIAPAQREADSDDQPLGLRTDGPPDDSFVDSFGFYEPEIEARMKGKDDGVRNPGVAVAPTGLFSVGMATDDFNFETPELLDLKPIYALGTDHLFPDKEDEEEKERRENEEAEKQRRDTEEEAMQAKEPSEEEKRQAAQEEEQRKELAAMGFGNFNYDEQFGMMDGDDGAAGEQREEDEESEAPFLHKSGSRTFNEEVDTLPPSARSEMEQEKEKQHHLGLQQSLVKTANAIEEHKNEKTVYGALKKPEKGYKESAAHRMVQQGENMEFLFPDQHVGK